MKFHYYDIKYPFLQYPFRDTDGTGYFMYSVPVPMLADMYFKRLGTIPQSFFDCGAAIGELVHQATCMGMRATGVDIKRYPIFREKYRPYFADGRIQIKNILDCEPVRADLAYCNGTLTYMDETTLPLALSKFRNVKMLIAIHNTTEDVAAARENGDVLLYTTKPRLIRSNDWWMKTFHENGFDTDFDAMCKCFCAVPRAKAR